MKNPIETTYNPGSWQGFCTVEFASIAVSVEVEVIAEWDRFGNWKVTSIRLPDAEPPHISGGRRDFSKWIDVKEIQNIDAQFHRTFLEVVAISAEMLVTSRVEDSIKEA